MLGVQNSLCARSERQRSSHGRCDRQSLCCREATRFKFAYQSNAREKTWIEDHSKSEGTVFVANVRVGDRVRIGGTEVVILATRGENRVRLGIDSPDKAKVISGSLTDKEPNHVTEPLKS